MGANTTFQNVRMHYVFSINCSTYFNTADDMPIYVIGHNLNRAEQQKTKIKFKQKLLNLAKIDNKLKFQTKFSILS